MDMGFRIPGSKFAGRHFLYFPCQTHNYIICWNLCISTSYNSSTHIAVVAMMSSTPKITEADKRAYQKLPSSVHTPEVKTRCWKNSWLLVVTLRTLLPVPSTSALLIDTATAECLPCIPSSSCLAFRSVLPALSFGRVCIERRNSIRVQSDIYPYIACMHTQSVASSDSYKRAAKDPENWVKDYISKLLPSTRYGYTYTCLHT